MASDYYLLIEGVTGESQASDMTNYIELESFSFGASNLSAATAYPRKSSRAYGGTSAESHGITISL